MSDEAEKQKIRHELARQLGVDPDSIVMVDLESVSDDVLQGLPAELGKTRQRYPQIDEFLERFIAFLEDDATFFTDEAGPGVIMAAVGQVLGYMAMATDTGHHLPSIVKGGGLSMALSGGTLRQRLDSLLEASCEQETDRRDS